MTWSAPVFGFGPSIVQRQSHLPHFAISRARRAPGKRRRAYTQSVIEFRSAAHEDHDRLKYLLRGTADTPYPVATVLAEKLQPGFAGEARVTVAARETELLGCMVTCGKYLRLLAVRRDQRRLGIGSELLALAEERASDEGSDRLIFAAEPGNYFTPGIWRKNDAAIDFLKKRGYTSTSEAVNLTASLTGNPALAVRRPSREIVRAAHDDREEITSWIAQEFGNIWAFEVQRCFEQAQPSLFIHRGKDEIRGFSAHCANNANLGTYGPAGVGREWRRSGYGRGLLLASLADLKARGFDRAIIQWAAALEFYERSCGAIVSERFAIMEKALN